ncbi:MAG: hypothetical protein KDD41_04760 [Flavobacteriales bacterium]|nr:hypothetical protein [Flavobacteriales bacterium]
MLRCVVSIFLVVLSLGLFAQKPTDDIRLEHFEPQFLAGLLHQKVNEYRKENKVFPLEEDETLMMAAQDQSEFILKEGRLTHDQPLKKKATPFDRVRFYDGMHGKVAENCSQFVIGTRVRIPGDRKSVLIKSYEDIANYIFNDWKNAKDEKTLLSKNYFRMATAFAVDVKKKTFTVTQLYGSEPFKLPSGVKPVNDDYKITPYDKTKCGDLERKYGYLPQLMSDNIFFKDGQIYFYFHDLETFKAVMDQSNDGIALDIIMRDQYACGKGNSFYPSEVHSGILLEPYMKSYLFGKNELEKDGQIEVSLGPIPDFVDTNNCEFNLLMLQEGCLCQTIVYNSFGGENLSSLDLHFLMDTLSVSKAADSVMNKLTFTIPFERNKAEFSNEDIKPFLDSLSLNRYDLKKIEVIAYSSIEGNVKGNQIIQQKRATSILNAIKKYKLQDVETAITTEENWDGFYESIKGSPYEDELKKYSKDELRKIINSDSLNYNLEPYLEEQRLAKVIMTVEKIFMDEALFNVLPQKLDKAIKNKDYGKAKVFQSVMLNNVDNGKIDKEELIDMKIPRLKGTIPLINNQIAFRWFYTDSENQDSLLKYLRSDIKTMLLVDPENSYLQYNLLVIRLLLWANKFSRESDPKYLLREIKSVVSSSQIEKWQTNRLILNYNLIAADYYYDNKQFKERESALEEVKKILLSSKLDRNQTYKIANYFMFQMRIDWAIELMKPWANKPNIDEEFLYTFLTIAIYNREKVTQDEYVEYMRRARDMNPERFCKLFGAPNMSFQLLKDIGVKEMYCNSCNN